MCKATFFYVIRKNYHIDIYHKVTCIELVWLKIEFTIQCINTACSYTCIRSRIFNLFNIDVINFAPTALFWYNLQIIRVPPNFANGGNVYGCRFSGFLR